MDNRALTALLSSLISHLLLLLTAPSAAATLHPLFPQFLNIQQTAATLSFLSNKRKRKRSQSPDPPIPRNPDSFYLSFNMTRSTFEWLASLLEPLLECQDPVNSPLNLPVETRLGIGLFRLATGSDYVGISTRFNVSEPVVKFCVNQLCRVLCTNFRFWVGFPTQAELFPVIESFERMTGLPNCCGVIHCTRFVVKRGSGDQSEPVAAQIVTDASSKILSIVAGLSGKKGNRRILKSSTLYSDIEANRLLNMNMNQYLVGDQGYPCIPWLMVPFDDQRVVSSYEENFNSALDLMMVSGFRTVDSLRKWGVLGKPVEEEMKTMVGYIGACSILHNALLTREDYSCLSDKSDDYLRSCYGRAESNSIDVDVSLKDELIEEKGFEIRNALATRARRCQ